MPNLDTRTVGTGPQQTAAWLDGVLIMLAGHQSLAKGRADAPDAASSTVPYLRPSFN